MELSVNNKKEQLLDGNKLANLLQQLKLYEKRGIAVAVNNTVIGRTEWDRHELCADDKITIITPTQGG